MNKKLEIKLANYIIDYVFICLCNVYVVFKYSSHFYTFLYKYL